MKNIIIPLSFILCSVISRAQPTTLRIDPANAQGGTASHIFDEVNYIPLETTKESLFGKVYKLFVTGDYYIVFDRETNSFFIFDKKGKFHSKIYGGNTQRSYIFISNVDKERKQILYAKNGSNSVSYFNFDGKKIKEDEPKYITSYSYFFPNNILASYDYSVNTRNSDSVRNEIILTKNDTIYREYFPYNRKTANLIEKDISMSSPYFFYGSGNDSAALFVRPYDYSIYQLTPTTLKKKYNFIFPLTNSLPVDFAINEIYSGKRQEYYMNNKDIIYGLSHTYQVGNTLFFRLLDWSGLMGKNSFMYNIKSNTLICVNHIVSDSLAYFLPIADDNMVGRDFANSNFLACDGKYIYTSYSSLAMFQAKEATLDKKPSYPPVLENYFKTESRKSNPVIVQLKLKENF